MQLLEDRRLLATVRWNTDADGFWDVAANWRDDDTGAARVPGFDDDAVIDRGAANPTITVRQGGNRLLSLTANERLVVTGGSLEPRRNSQFNAAWEVAGGSLGGIEGAVVTLNGPGTWTGGQLGHSHNGGGSLVQNSILTLSGSADKTAFGVLINTGTIRHGGDGDFIYTDGGRAFENRAGAVYEFTGTGGLLGGSRFDNSGRIRKSGDPGEAILDSVTNNLGGTFDVLAGRLKWTAGGSGTGGVFNVAAGATFNLADAPGGAALVLAGHYTGAGGGQVVVSGPLRGGVEGIQPTDLNFPPGMLVLDGGRFFGDGRRFNNHGSLTIRNAATWGGGRYVNTGVITLEGDARLDISRGTTLDNAGLFDLRGDGDLMLDNIFPLPSFINNSGIFRKSAGLGVSEFGSAFPSVGIELNNTGTVEVLSGTLRIAAPGRVLQIEDQTLREGVWNVANFATLDFPDEDPIVTNEADVTLDGPAAAFSNLDALAFNGGTLRLLNGRDFATQGDFTNGLPQLTADVTTFSLGVGALAGIGFDPLTGHLFAYPKMGAEIVEFTGAGIEAPPRIPRPGVATDFFDLDVLPHAVNFGGTQVPAGTLLAVNGQPGQHRLFALDPHNGAVLANLPLPISGFRSGIGGVYHAERQTFFVMTGASSTLHEMDLSTGSQVNTFNANRFGVPSMPTLTFSSGDLEVDPATGNLLLVGSNQPRLREFTPDGDFVRDIDLRPLRLQNITGLAADDATGDLWFANADGQMHRVGPFTFPVQGELTLGVGSALTVNGNFVDAARDTIHVEIGGRPATEQFGRLAVTGSANLGGRFHIVLADGFGPTKDDVFEIATYATRTGDLPTFSGLAPFFTATVESGAVKLTALSTAFDMVADPHSLDVPALATPGQDVTISYTVRNFSTNAISGDWDDSLYLSRDAVYSPDDKLIGRVPHTGGLAGLGSYQATFTGPLPGAIDGDYRVIVIADSKGRVADVNRANNRIAAPNATAVTSPLLPLDSAVTQTLAGGQERYYRLDVPPGRGDVVVEFAFAAPHHGEAFLRFRDVPDRAAFDAAALPLGAANRVITLPAAQAGTYYVLVRGLEGTNENFTILARRIAFALDGAEPRRGANLGSATTQVRGVGFTENTIVELVDDGGTRVAQASALLLDANRLAATFDLRGVSPGVYDLRATDGELVAVLDGAYEVVVGNPGDLRVDLITPRLRDGRIYQGLIEYTNTGDTDLISPVIVIESDQLLTLDPVAAPSSNTLRLLAIGPTLGTGVLAPGETARVPFRFFGADMFLRAGSIDGDRTETMDWEALRTAIRPADADAAWDAAFNERFVAAGDTLGDYARLLAETATLHRQRKGMATSDINELHRFLIVEGLAERGVTLRGRIFLNDLRQPAGGIVVTATDAQTGASGTAVSSADGLVRFQDLPPGTYDLVFSDVLPPADLAPVVVPHEGSADVQTWLVRSGGGIRGRVAIPGLLPPPDPENGFLLTVLATDQDGNRYTAPVDARGVYEFRGLAPGVYELFFDTPSTLPVRVSGVEVLDEQTTDLVDLFSPAGGAVSGVVRNLATNAPLEGVTVVVDDAGNPRAVPTDANGFYRLDGLTPGAVTLAVSEPGAAPVVLPNVLVQANQVTGQIDIYLNFSTLGSVLGALRAGGAPVARAKVDLVQGGVLVQSAIANAQGNYSLTDVKPGDYDLVVNAFGFAVQSIPVTVTAAVATRQDVTLAAAATLRGTVTQTGVRAVNPLPGIQLVLLGPAEQALLLRTDENGGFGVSRLAPGDYTLMLADGSHRRAIHVAGDADVLTANFEIAAGAIVGRLVDANGETPLRGIKVTLVADGQALLSDYTLADGRFAFAPLAPGTYDVHFSHASRFFAPLVGVSVQAGAFADAGTVAAAAASLMATAIDEATGLPFVSPVGWSLQPLGQPESRQRLVVGESGAVTFALLAPGRYLLKAAAADYATVQRIVDVAAGTNSLELTLARGGRMRGTVASAGGALEGIIVSAYDPASPERVWASVTDAAGNYEIAAPAGVYRLLVADLRDVAPALRFAPQQFDGVTVANGGVAVRNATPIRGMGSISGVLNGGAGGGVNTAPFGATVTLQNEDGLPVARANAAGDGSFRFDGLFSGTYRLTVAALGFHFEESSVAIVGEGAAVTNPAGVWAVPALAGPNGNALLDSLAAAGLGLPAEGESAHVAFLGDAAALLGAISQVLAGEGEDPSLAQIVLDAAIAEEVLREIVRELLGEPKRVESDRIRGGAIPDYCGPEVRAALQNALNWQRITDNAFDAWYLRWTAQQEVLWANVGLFGINLLVFAGELLGKATFFSSTVNEVRRNRELAIDFGLLNPEHIDAAFAVFRRLDQELDRVVAAFTTQAAAAQRSLDNVNAFSTSVGTGLTLALGFPSLGDVVREFGRIPSWRSLEDVSRFVSTVGQFGGGLFQLANALTTLVPQLITLAQRVPGLRAIADKLGPIAAALNTVGVAAQGVRDFIGDMEALKNFEDTYLRALKRRNDAFNEFLRLRALCEDPDDTDDPKNPYDEEFFRLLFTIRSSDPNEIVGPEGVGEPHFVRSAQTFPYVIFYENMATATAPAQEVVITQQLDAHLDWTTFELGDFGFGNLVIDVPVGRNAYQTRVDLRDSLGFFVDFEAAINVATGLATWRLVAIDPETGDLIADADLGFLPPNVNSPEGEGFVEYFIRPRTNIASGAAITAQARIVFDLNEAIDTPVWSNAIDDLAPQSAVAALPATTTASSFTVSWSGDDGAGSGIASFDVFVSVDGGAFVLWQAGTTALSAVYDGEGGRTYRFYSVARDRVGWVEEPPAAADAQTTVSLLPWTNQPDPHDVNDDGKVDVTDLLRLVQFIRARGSNFPLPPPDANLAPPPYVDVNADGRVTLGDLLAVVRALREQARNAQQGEGEAWAWAEPLRESILSGEERGPAHGGGFWLEAEDEDQAWDGALTDIAEDVAARTCRGALQGLATVRRGG